VQWIGWIVACSAPAPHLDSVPGPFDTAHETAPDDSAAPLACTASLAATSTMATALDLAWACDEVDRASATVLLASGASTTASSVPEETVVLAPEHQDVTVDLEFWRGDEVVATATVTASTGDLPDGPSPTLTAIEGSVVTSQVVLYALEDVASSSVTLMAGTGAPLWRLQGDDFDGQTVDAAQSDAGGRGVIVSQTGARTTEPGKQAAHESNRLTRFSWRGVLTDEIPAAYSHHLFDQPSPGTVAWIRARREHTPEGELDIVWDQIVLSTWDGDETVVVDTESIGDFGSNCNVSSFYVGACEPHHTNSVDCREDLGTCLASLHNADRVVELTLDDGGLVEDWTLFPVQDEAGEPMLGFDRAHDVQWSADGESILVMNDATDGAFATRLRRGQAPSELVATWSYPQDTCILGQALGSIQELEHGHHVIGFSTPNNLLREVDGDGDVLWEADFGGLPDARRCEHPDEVAQVLGEARVLDPSALGANVIVVF